MVDISRDIIKILAAKGPLDLTQIAIDTLNLEVDFLGATLSSLEKKGVVTKYFKTDSQQIVYRLF